MIDIPVLETERLRLRAPSQEDFDMDTAFYNSGRSKDVGGNKTEDEIYLELTSALGHWALNGFGFWAVEDKVDRTYYGRVGLMKCPHWPDVELGWLLMNAQAQGKSIAYEAAINARDFAYSQLGIKKLVSTSKETNTRSINLAMRMGAKLEKTECYPGYGTCHVYRHPSLEELQ